MTEDRRIEIDAHAKVNLTLEVLGRRDDGYHEIVSVLQTIDLHDTLSLEPADDLTLTCDVPELESPDNLVLRAAHLLREASGYRGGCRLSLAKKVPAAAGLGGGSSDAAAALSGLNRLWELGMSLEELTPLAARLGSDVPFFLRGGTAMVQGRGERVRPLPPADIQWVVVLAPRILMPDKTASVYARLSESDFTPGQLTRKLEARIRGGGDVPPQFLFNVFDEVALQAFPDLRRYWDTFRVLGAREIHVAGTGPSLYAPVSRRELGTAIELLLRHTHGWDAHLAAAWHPVDGGGA
jgi:4-diphosphocytidyl-2-C-methyl-D-erythritol kinase